MTQKQESEHLPHSLIVDLKHDVEALKKNLSKPDTKTHELILEIESLKDAVHQLNVIFDKALKEMKDEDIVKTVHNLTEKLNSVVGQNETIAQGMIAIADKLDNFMNRQMTRPAAPSIPVVQHTMGAPMAAGRIAPRPEMVMSATEPAGLPPPPPGPAAKKRVGLF